MYTKDGVVMAGGYVRFGVLGVIEAWQGTALVDLGHARQRQVLAALLVDVGRAVPADALMERVWGERVPQRGRVTLYGYLSRLRQALSGAEITREQGGYRLAVDAEAVDLHWFRRLSSQAREADTDERAVALWQEALGLWRGDAFVGLDTAWFNAQRARLEAERLAAQLELVEARLRLGQHAQILAECSTRAEVFPLDERVAGQLMLALYRSGRQAEALRHYDVIRRRLGDELGCDPGLALRQLHQQIIAADPAVSPNGSTPEGAGPGLTQSPLQPLQPLRSKATDGQQAEQAAASIRIVTPGIPARSPAAALGRNCLPRGLPDFTGREEELAQLVASAQNGAAVHAVDGMAGVGKTSLAVQAGQLLADRFPDGALFVDLQGHSLGKTPLTPDEALETLLGQLGVTAPSDAQARWRAATAASRLLVILDNAVDETQVAPLLPAGPSLVIVTSRARMPALAGAQPLSLGVLTQAAATTFFARIVGTDRAAAEPEAVARIVRLCAGLPLALRLSGARLAHRTAWPVAHLSAQLASARRQLPKLFADQEVALAFRMSHEQLSPVDQQVFCALGRHPGTDADAAVIAVMTGMPVAAADDALQRLVDVHLAEEAAVGRYRQHDLLRQYARGLSDDPLVTERMLIHYLKAVTEAAAHLADGGTQADAAQTWLMTEQSNLLAATRCAAAEGHTDYAWQLAISMWHFLSQNLAGDPIELLEKGLSAAQDAADGGETMLNTLLALAHWSAGHPAVAYNLLSTSAEQLENTESHAHTLALLGLMLLQRGDHAAAYDHAERAFTELAQLPTLSPLGLDAKIITYWTRGTVRGLRSEHEAALSYLRAAYTGCQELSQLSPNDHVLTALSRCLIALGTHHEALSHLQQARDLRQRIGDKEGEAETLVLIGTAQRTSGHPQEALTPQRLAVTMLDNDTRLQAYARIELGHTLYALGQADEALQQHTLALTLARQGRHLHEEAQAHHALARLLAAIHPQTAQQHEETAAQISTQLDLRHPTPLPHLRPAGW
ncbi:BTAD domain-containing putative transcriptional regulator [Streptomyces sp. DG2A-72]|uniref:AfsR/SARP family transcriptional regulator n=1 Tax=Streptomyces sp. DG2A-72 TaxID=3051386 RepID=UPI00265C6D41|nr:AfsR/SARP family transcriptional regulator [Streptomyces sp. DG2A-72]MDO0936314.1 BTAD domain-containing putative transcriptional regulator [Streptomyces sp. DG2A-72]